tara:strand:+ start:147 stop:305 length:159 start_codon:yes stop_codon:yes gene_type:complete
MAVHNYSGVSSLGSVSDSGGDSDDGDSGGDNTGGDVTGSVITGNAFLDYYWN